GVALDVAQREGRRRRVVFVDARGAGPALRRAPRRVREGVRGDGGAGHVAHQPVDVEEVDPFTLEVRRGELDADGGEGGVEGVRLRQERDGLVEVAGLAG